jgi:formylglycine-generating enzyme
MVYAMTASGNYCIDSTEVTSAQYLGWVAGGPSIAGQPTECTTNATFSPSTVQPSDDRPIVYIDWCDAYAFCKAKGKRLCGKIGGGANPYTDFDSSTSSQWYNACSLGGTRAFPYMGTYNADACNDKPATGTGVSVPVGSLATCEGGLPGIFDMSGNAWEWEDSCEFAVGPMDMCRRRGGSFLNDQPSLDCPTEDAQARSMTANNVGFRCCADVP